MKIQSYYRVPFPKINNGDFEINDEPLIVNCAGFWRREPSSTPIITDRPAGRKDFYLMYMTNGSLDFRLPSGDDVLTRGSFIIHQPHVGYYHMLSPNTPLSYLWVHFTGFHAKRLLSTLGIETNRIYKTDTSDKKTKLISDAFERLFSEFANRRPGFDLVQVPSRRGRKDIMHFCLNEINKAEGTKYKI